jgi:hypothetical protein
MRRHAVSCPCHSSQASARGAPGSACRTDADQLLDQLRGAAVRIHEVSAPNRSGVYAWFLDNDDVLAMLHLQHGEPLYVGMSPNLAQRSDETHFQSGQTGFSTLRRSLGALLKEDLCLKARPRGNGPSEQNYRCYRFDDSGEERLTHWMRRHLLVAVAPQSDPERVETELIALCQPPFNLTKWASPHAREIKALRKACVEEARRDHPR